MKKTFLLFCIAFVALAGCTLPAVTVTPTPTVPADELPTPTQIISLTGVPEVTPIGGQATPTMLDIQRRPDFFGAVNTPLLIVHDAQGFDTGSRIYQLVDGGEFASVWEPFREDLGGRRIQGFWCPIASDYSRFVSCRYLDLRPFVDVDLTISEGETSEDS